jgi:hypothetical protein
VHQGMTRIVVGVVGPNNIRWCLDNTQPHRFGSAVRIWRCHPGTRPVNQTWRWKFTGSFNGVPTLQLKPDGTGLCLVNYHNRADARDCRSSSLRAVFSGTRCFFRIKSGNGRYLRMNGTNAQAVFVPFNPQIAPAMEFYFPAGRCPASPRRASAAAIGRRLILVR